MKLEADYLDEDPVIPTQKYYLLSYLLPDKTEGGMPMIKIRGAFRDQESAQKRVKMLQEQEKYFDIVLGELGKWSPLLDKYQLESREDVQVQYQEEMMQTIMKKFKEKNDNSAVAFEKRKREMLEKARHEGSAAGQLEAASRKEEAVVVLDRIEGHKQAIEELSTRLKEIQEHLVRDEEKIKDYTEEEIEASKKRFAEFQKARREGQEAGPSGASLKELTE